MVERLSERIPTGEVEIPRHPDAAWRAATEDDVDAMLAFFAAVAAVDHPNWVETRDEAREPFELSHIDATRDTMLAIGSDGGVLAYGAAIMPPGRETLVRSIILGAVHPSVRGRGLGTALLQWQLSRAREQLRSSESELPGWIMAYADERAPDAAALLEKNGQPLTRHFFSLERDLSKAVSEYRHPHDVTIRGWSDEVSEATRAARNDAFRDHWGSQSTGAEAWASMVHSEVFAPELSFVAVEESGRVAGFVLALLNRGDWQGQGFTSSYIQLVGVVRDRRGQGLARALLARHLRAARDAGLERATLDVDAANPSGALALYEGIGFAVAHTHMSYVRVY